jgi:hypothetical protein
MKPTRCPVCQGDQLTKIILMNGGGFFVSFLSFAALHAVGTEREFRASSELLARATTGTVLLV